MRPWGPRGAGKVTRVWVRGALICIARVIFAEPFTYKWIVWGFVEKSVNIRRFEGVGAVLAVDPGLVVETGPGGVGRRQS